MKTIDEMEMPAPDTIVNCKNGGPIAAMFFYAAAEQDLGEIASEHGFETRVTTMESDCENLQERWEEGSGDMAALMDEWQPATPEGWMLGVKLDTEDGPIAIFIKPSPVLAERLANASDAT